MHRRYDDMALGGHPFLRRDSTTDLSGILDHIQAQVDGVATVPNSLQVVIDKGTGALSVEATQTLPAGAIIMMDPFPLLMRHKAATLEPQELVCAVAALRSHHRKHLSFIETHLVPEPCFEELFARAASELTELTPPSVLDAAKAVGTYAAPVCLTSDGLRASHPKPDASKHALVLSVPHAVMRHACSPTAVIITGRWRSSDGAVSPDVSVRVYATRDIQPGDVITTMHDDCDSLCAGSVDHAACKCGTSRAEWISGMPWLWETALTMLVLPDVSLIPEVPCTAETFNKLRVTSGLGGVRNARPLRSCGIAK